MEMRGEYVVVLPGLGLTTDAGGHVGQNAATMGKMRQLDPVRHQPGGADADERDRTQSGGPPTCLCRMDTGKQLKLGRTTSTGSRTAVLSPLHYLVESTLARQRRLMVITFLGAALRFRPTVTECCQSISLEEAGSGVFHPWRNSQRGPSPHRNKSFLPGDNIGVRLNIE
jgi:hypothetical protein